MSAHVAISVDQGSALNVPVAWQRHLPVSALAQDEWDRALRATSFPSSFAQDREIYGEGDKARVFFKVRSGVVRTCKFLDDGSRQVDAFYVEGDVFGVGGDALYPLTAEAVSDCTLTSYRRRGLEGLASADGAFSAQLFSYAMRSTARAQDHSRLLGRRCAVEKVLAFLVQWAGDTPGERIMTLAMPRRDIADYLGLTNESVSRALTQLQKDGVIELPSARQVRFKAQRPR